MQIDPDLHDFIDQLQRELPPPRDPTDMAAQAQRYAAASRRLPSVLVPVTSGDFKLRPGGKPLPARMHWPTGAQAPVLMAWFVGGAWAAGDLDTHDGLCRQLAHDLGVAVACVQLPIAAGNPLLQSSESALLALRTLLEGRAKLGVQPALLVGGDGSGGHAALDKAGFKAEFGEITMKPQNETAFEGEDALKMQKLLDALEALDDVQEVYTTAVIDE